MVFHCIDALLSVCTHCGDDTCSVSLLTAAYDCTQMFEVYRLVQAFDPSFAAQFIDVAWVDALRCIPPLAEHVPRLKYELPTYLTRCAGTAYDHNDVDEFTKGVLLFWNNYGQEFPTWALCMRVGCRMLEPTPSTSLLNAPSLLALRL